MVQESLVLGVLTLGMAGLAGGAYYLNRNRLQDITETETSTTGALTEGLVELEGTVVAGDAEPLTAPLSGADAVVVDWEIVADDEDDEGTHDRSDGYRAVDFYLEDEDGRVRIEPAVPETTRISGSNTTTEHLYAGRAVDDEFVDGLRAFDDDLRPDDDGFHRTGSERISFGARAGSVTGSRNRDRRYVERIVRPGDDVYVLGTAARDDDGEFVVRRDDRGRFVLSDMSEDELTADLGGNQLWLGVVAAVCLLVSLVSFARTFGVL